MGTSELNAGGNPAMDWHPIQGGVEILQVASYAAETGVKRWPDGPTWPECGPPLPSLWKFPFSFVHFFTILVSQCFSLGLSTALVERDDFSSGTSSRSTKLIHGGVRYLQKAIMQLDREQVRSLFLWIPLWR